MSQQTAKKPTEEDDRIPARTHIYDFLVVSNRLPVDRVGEGADAGWRRSPGADRT